MNIIDNFNKFNEDMHIASNEKLADSVHDIMTDLKPGEEMTLEELSKKLKDKNIQITPEVLKEIIFVQWWRNDNYTIFKKKDKKWLDFWPGRYTVEMKRKRTSPLGKGRKKAISTNYKNYTGFRGY